LEQASSLVALVVAAYGNATSVSVSSATTLSLTLQPTGLWHNGDCQPGFRQLSAMKLWHCFEHFLGIKTNYYCPRG